MAGKEGTPERRSPREIAASAAKRLRRPTTGEQPPRPTVAEARVSQTPAPLLPEERQVTFDLKAILNEYDLSTPEEQSRVLREVSETGDTVVPGEAYQRGRAAARISDVSDVSREQGLRDMETL